MVSKVDCINDFNDKVGLFEDVNDSDTATCNQRIKVLNELQKVLVKYDHGRPLLSLASRAIALDTRLGHLSNDPKFLPVLEEVIRVRQAIRPYFSIKPISEIELKIGLFIDIESEDENGAVVMGVVNYFENKLPILTTKSLLKKLTNDQREILFKSQHEWDFLKHTESDFVLFLPKSLKPELELNHKLVDLDFNPQLLVKTPLAVLLALSSSKATVENLRSLFMTDPNVDKLFHLTGHGNPDVVGGLNSKTYLKLLKLLEDQRCKGLVISSCFAGGKNNLLTLTGNSFTTIVRSMGDFETNANQEAESNSAKFTDAFARLLSNGPPTQQAFQKMVRKAELKPTKMLKNYNQISFPHSARSPAGFRPLLEHGGPSAITFLQLRQAEVNKEHIIRIRECTCLELYPLAIRKTLAFWGRDPVLISMVPGPSHHFIDTILSAESEPADFFQRMIEFHNVINDPKGFFIGTFDHENEVWTDIGLLLTESGFQLTYAQNGKYYYKVKNRITEIDWITHAKVINEMELSTVPTSYAVSVSSGGQENDDDFRKAIDDHFWSVKGPKVIRALNKESSVLVETLNIEDENPITFLRNLSKPFRYLDNPKKVWIDKLICKNGVFNEIALLMKIDGYFVYRKGEDHFSFDGKKMKQIDTTTYFEIAKKISNYKTSPDFFDEDEYLRKL